MSSRISYIPSNSLEHLQCSNCNKHLSHFPVYLEPNGEAICGRCQSSTNAIHNALYQYAVEYQKFPCCNSSYGCLEQLKPNDMPQHEKLCTFRKFPCPMLLTPKCDWEGFAKDMLEHFEAKHPNFILSESQFEIDFINSHKENYLLPYGEEFYIVNRVTVSTSNTFFCTVTYVGSNPDVGNYSYKIIMEDSNKCNTHEIIRKLNTTVDIDGVTIRTILKDPMSIIARVEVFQETDFEENGNEDWDSTNPAIDYDMLRELECLVCMEYMVPPIHQCVTGHSICLKCKEDLTECPTCKREFGNTQNFALAQLINNYIVYPCKHDRCRFTAKAKDIKQHEATCTFGPFKCPLKDYLYCTTEVIFSEIYDHILNNHYENLLEMDTVSYPWDHVDPDNDIIKDCHILRFGNKLFKLHFKFQEYEVRWAMQLIGNAEESKKYSFDIDITDNSNCNRFYCKMKCSPLTDMESAFQDNQMHIFADFDQIRSLITTDLIYRVKIIQNIL